VTVTVTVTTGVTHVIAAMGSRYGWDLRLAATMRAMAMAMVTAR
jgi:hypothetical protein